MTYGEMDIALSIRLGDPVSTGAAAGSRWTAAQRLAMLNEAQRKCAQEAPDHSLWPLTVTDYGGYNSAIEVREVAFPSLYDYLRISYITFGEPDIDKSSTTTSAGNAGGTTLVDTALTEADDYWNRDERVVMITSGTCKGQMRAITDFVASTDTLTVSSAFTAQIATAVTYKIVSINKDDEAMGTEVSSLHRADIESSSSAMEGTASNPKWYFEGNKLKFYPPVDDTSWIRFYMIRTPGDMSDTTVECSMPQWSHEVIADYASYLGLFSDVDQERKAQKYEASSIYAFRRGSRITKRMGVLKPLSLMGEVRP